MDDMREIVDIRTVDAAIRAGGGVWFGLCLLAGFLLRMVGHRPSSLRRGLYVGMIGPIVMGLWSLYSWMTRYDPQTGYFGLDKVWVLVVNALIFVAVGGLYGLGLRWVWNRATPPSEEAIPPHSAK
jgi:hypothetical protein